MQSIQNIPFLASSRETNLQDMQLTAKALLPRKHSHAIYTYVCCTMTCTLVSCRGATIGLVLWPKSLVAYHQMRPTIWKQLAALSCRKPIISLALHYSFASPQCAKLHRALHAEEHARAGCRQRWRIGKRHVDQLHGDSTLALLVVRHRSLAKLRRHSTAVMGHWHGYDRSSHRVAQGGLQEQERGI